MLLLEAMARMEGWGKPGTRPTRNNNPLDIEWGEFAREHGAVVPQTVTSRFAVFPTAASGFACAAALVRDLETKYSGLTVQTLIRGQRDAKGNVLPGGYSGWAPPVENDDNLCLANVLEWTGLDADTPLRDVVLEVS